MNKYKATDSPNGRPIALIECERETERFVYVNGGRYGKLTDYESYFDTFDEAKSYLLEKIGNRVNKRKNYLKAAQDHLGKIKGWVEKPLDK